MSVIFALSGCALFGVGAPIPPTAQLPPQPMPAALPPQPLYPPSPQQAEAEIARWFAAAGYRDYQVEALVEHARVESGFRACAVGPGDLRYTFQWGGTRLQRLHEFAHTSGCPQLDTQLAFADKELRNEPQYSCFWGAASEAGALAALRRGFGRGRC